MTVEISCDFQENLEKLEENLGKYDVILTTFPRIHGLIFENFWRNSKKTEKVGGN